MSTVPIRLRVSRGVRLCSDGRERPKKARTMQERWVCKMRRKMPLQATIVAVLAVIAALALAGCRATTSSSASVVPNSPPTPSIQNRDQFVLELENRFRRTQPARNLMANEVVLLDQASNTVRSVCGDEVKGLKVQLDHAISNLFPELPHCRSSRHETVTCDIQGVTTNGSVVYIAFVFVAGSQLATGIVSAIGVVHHDESSALNAVSELFAALGDGPQGCSQQPAPRGESRGRGSVDAGDGS